MFLILCVPIVPADPTRLAWLCGHAGLVVCHSFAILACGAHIIVLRYPSQICISRCKLCTIYMLYMCGFAKVKDLSSPAWYCCYCCFPRKYSWKIPFSSCIFALFCCSFKRVCYRVHFSPLSLMYAWTLLFLHRCCTFVPSLHISLPGKCCLEK